MEEEMGVIYKATSKTSLKSYIGQTKNFEQRKKQHLQSPPLYPFQRALQKYGHEDFEWHLAAAQTGQHFHPHGTRCPCRTGWTP